MHKVVKEISKKKNLDNNLKVFGEYMSNMYSRFSNVCLSMNYFTYFQMMEDADSEKYKDIINLHEKVNKVISNYINSNLDLENDIKKLDEVRETIINIMKVLTSYADIFDRYEYILNRIEYKFKENNLLEKHDDTDFTRKIMQYIVSDEDSSAINMRISEIIGELPIRMTKAKFFERLNEGINVYRDTDKKSISDFLYMVGTSAMIELPDGLENTFPVLYSIYEELNKCDFDTVDEDKFNDLHGKIVYAADFIQESVNIYMMLQQIVNEVYSIVLLNGDITDAGEENVYCKKIISFVNDSFKNNSFKSLDEEIEESFIRLEGVQEMLHEKYMNYEYQLDELKKFDSLSGFEDLYERLYKSGILVSDSLFVEFDDNNTNGELTDDEFTKIKNDFINKVADYLSDKSRPVKRAVMASIIASLPTFFNNLQELQDHVYSSLESCRDKAEKAAVVEIINMLISDDI